MKTQLHLPFQNIQNTTWTVSELTRYVRQMFDADYRLRDVDVDGELSNLSQPRSGHLFFTLKDKQAALQCVMWRKQVCLMTYKPRAGDRVLVRGYLSVYETGGRYQLYAEEMQLAGTGDLLQQLEELKSKLAAEGMFEQERKYSLPRIARSIVVVTSATGAAIKDVVKVVSRRWPIAELMLIPAAVQGEYAPIEIVAALQAANRYRPDVILLVRGGGSLEDIWAFNDERVARAISTSNIPIVTGVGHETDITIADLAADVRASTPSAAAEMATPDQRELRLMVSQKVSSLAIMLREQTKKRRSTLGETRVALGRLSPIAQLDSARLDLSRLSHRRKLALRHTLQLLREQTMRLVQSLSNLGPSTTLARGYAIVTRVDTTNVVRRGADVHIGEELDVRVAEGQFGVRVTRPEGEN